MVELFRCAMVLLLAHHCLGVVFFKKHQSVHEEWLHRNRTKIGLDSRLESVEPDLKMKSNNPLPLVGETVAFESTNGITIYGTIDSVSSHGTNIFVYSGSAQFGGHFHLSYSSGVIVGEVYPSNEDYKYQILPKDSSSNWYTMRAVPRSVYDNDDSPADEDPSLEFEGDAAELRRKCIQSQPHGVPDVAATTDRISDQVSADQVGADYNPALYSSNILDVMFIFTPQALASVGGSQSSMEALAALSVQLANEAYANSLLPIRMRMVSVATLKDTTYVQKGFTTELNRLRYDYDGFFDDEMNIRTSVGADVVIMFTSDTTYCGLAYMWATENLAFAVVSTQCPVSVVHEVAHNIGCDHDRMTAHNYDYSQYNLGYCWDTSAKTCSRSVMAYAGCVTTGRRTNCPRMPYFSSPLVTQGALKRTTGIATSDNARVIREQLSRAVSWRRSKVPGGLITSAQPSAVPVGRCEPVRIKGFHIGTATSTITSVTLNGVPVQRILSQSLDEVEVLVGLSDMAGTGDIVVTTSSGYQTTLAGAFSYQATSGSFVTDFDSGLGTMWVSTGAADWSVVRYCDTEPCSNAPVSGPVVGAGGSGNFLKVQAFEISDDVALLTATFNLDTTASGCVEAVTSLSLFYHLWGPHSDLCGGSLTVSMLTVGSAAWTTILTASTVQAQQSDPWLPLQFSFPNPTAVAAIRITADPYSGQATCYYWGSVAVDRINVTKTTTCSKDNCDFISAAPTIVPTAVPTVRPSTIRPTTAMPFSRQPTVARTPAPTILVNVLETVRFDCSQTLTGVTVEQFLADPSNTDQFLRAAAANLNVAPEALCCATVTASARRRLLATQAPTDSDLAHRPRNAVGVVAPLTTSGIAITYQVQLQVQYQKAADTGTEGGEDESGSQDGILSNIAAAMVDTVKQQLTASVASGNFLSALKQVLSPEIASADFGVAPVSTSSFSTPVSEIVQLSVDPTLAPTTRSAGGAASTAGLTLDLVAYIMLAVIALVAGVSGYMFYIYCWSPEQKKGTRKMWSLAAAARNRTKTGAASTPATYDQLMGGHGEDDAGDAQQVASSSPADRTPASPIARRDSARSNGSASIQDGGSPRCLRSTSNADTVISGYRPASGRQNSLDLRPLSLSRSPRRGYSNATDGLAGSGGVELADVMASRMGQWTAGGRMDPVPISGPNAPSYMPHQAHRDSYREVVSSSSSNHPAIDEDGWEQIPPELLLPPAQQPPPQRQQLLAPGILPRMAPQVVNGSGTVFPPQLHVQIGDASIKCLPRAPMLHPQANSTTTSYEVAMATYRQVSRNAGAHEYEGSPRYSYSYSDAETPKSAVSGASTVAGVAVVQGRRRGSGPCPPAPPGTPQYTATPSSTTSIMSLTYPQNMRSYSISSTSTSRDDHEAYEAARLQRSNSRSYSADSTHTYPRPRYTEVPKGAPPDSYSAWSQRVTCATSSTATEPAEYPTIWLGGPHLSAKSLSTDVVDGTRTPSLYSRSLSASHDTVDVYGNHRTVPPPTPLPSTASSSSTSPRFLSHYQCSLTRPAKQQPNARLDALVEEGNEGNVH